MLDIWSLQSEEFSEAFCKTHKEETEEALDPSNLKLYLSEECPYPGYSFVRIELTPQIIKRGSEKQSISSRCISYALYANSTAQVQWKIIPLKLDSSSVYLTNGILKYRVTADNIFKYLIFCGHLFYNPPFYFFYRIPQLYGLTKNIPDEIRARVEGAVTNYFEVTAAGDIKILLEQSAYPLLGNTVECEIPCFHKGDLHLSKVRLSTDGIPEMIDSRKLQIEGIFDEEANYNYYPLDFSPSLAYELSKYRIKSERAHSLTLRTLFYDTILQTWIMPLFAFHLFVLLALGLKGDEIFAYFERLESSTLLTICSGVIGIVGILIAIFRYVFLEVTNYLRKIIPSIWSQLAASIEAVAKMQLSKLGYLFFFSITSLEYSLKLLMTISLLLYALSQAHTDLLPAMNLGQSITSVLSHLPIIGDSTKLWFATTPFMIPQLPKPAENGLDILVGFLFSTVFLGLLVRIFFLVRARY